MGRREEIHDAGSDRSRERQSNRQAARRGSLSEPALTAGYRDRRQAFTPRTGTRSGEAIDHAKRAQNGDDCEYHRKAFVIAEVPKRAIPLALLRPEVVSSEELQWVWLTIDAREVVRVVQVLYGILGISYQGAGSDL